MSVCADFALYDRNGGLIAVAEVKNKSGTSCEWTAKLRRNMLAHGGFHRTDFFLLVTSDKLYLWKGAGTEPAIVQPAFEVDARPIGRGAEGPPQGVVASVFRTAARVYAQLTARKDLRLGPALQCGREGRPRSCRKH
jgi:hypothetical protein